MELTLSILLPQATDLTHLNLSEEVYEWNETKYPQSLAKTNFNGNWIIEETPIAAYLLKQVSIARSQAVWKCLSVQGEGLNEYVQGIIDPESNIPEDNTLSEIFDKTVNLSHDWIVVFEINDNPIKESYYDTIEYLKSHLAERLKGKNSFIVYKG